MVAHKEPAVPRKGTGQAGPPDRYRQIEHTRNKGTEAAVQNPRPSGRGKRTEKAQKPKREHQGTAAEESPQRGTRAGAKTPRYRGRGPWQGSTKVERSRRGVPTRVDEVDNKGRKGSTNVATRVGDKELRAAPT